MEITNSTPITKDGFKNTQAAQDEVPPEEKRATSRQIDGLKEDILSGD